MKKTALYLVTALVVLGIALGLLITLRLLSTPIYDPRIYPCHFVRKSLRDGTLPWIPDRHAGLRPPDDVTCICQCNNGLRDIHPVYV